MNPIADEAELARIAGTIAGYGCLAPAERALVGDKVAPGAVEPYRALIAAGMDPLGDAFLALRSPEIRREAGAVYTPTSIVDAMIGWAAHRGDPVRVVDPGAGSGRFIAAAALAFPEAELVACDVDPLATLILRANAAVLGFSDRLDLQLTDYRILELPHVDGPTLYIGNPPYVRHHGVSEDAKTWFGATAKRLGFKASKLAGLHVHFFLRTRELASPGDYGAFVTSSEWMDVNYGSLVREMLADGLGGCSLQVIAARGMPFADAMTTAAITTFLVGARPEEFTVREVASPDELDDLDAGRLVPWADARREPRWSRMVNPPPVRPDGLVELGELFRVHRGLVTGNNEVFIAGSSHPKLPYDCLVPAVTRAKDLIDAGPRLTPEYASKLRRLVVLPVSSSDRIGGWLIEGFKNWAKARRGDASWTAKSRAAWWSLTLRDAAPILCSYMGRRPPVFVRNDAGVPHVNIAHGLYPRVPMSAVDLDAYSAYLSKNVRVSDGRTYAGGLTKFEPKEIERILVPCLNRIHEQSHDLVAIAVHEGCRPLEGDLSQGADRGAGRSVSGVL